LAQHRVEQAGPDFSASIFDHSKTIAEIERAVATLAALLVTAERSQSARSSSFPVMCPAIRHPRTVAST